MLYLPIFYCTRFAGKMKKETHGRQFLKGTIRPCQAAEPSANRSHHQAKLMFSTTPRRGNEAKNRCAMGCA